jgi:chemotaxis protein histidine kinase CheA
MPSNPEPALDLSEIITLYKEDARHSVEMMRQNLQRWSEVGTRGAAWADLRKFSHQLRGSGRTYGFQDVTRVSKAMEHIMDKIGNGSLKAEERVRRSLQAKIERLAQIFKS